MIKIIVNYYNSEPIIKECTTLQDALIMVNKTMINSMYGMRVQNPRIVMRMYTDTDSVLTINVKEEEQKMYTRKHTDEQILSRLKLTREEVKRHIKDKDYIIWESYEDYYTANFKRCEMDDINIDLEWEDLEEVSIDEETYHVERFQ